MGLYLGVKKFFENSKEVAYEVESKDFGGVHYFMYIKKGERKIKFFEDPTLKFFLGEINLDKQDELINIQGIAARVIWHGISKLIKCMELNDYKEYLDYCA